MSSPLAIGAVSAVLRNLLDNGLDRRRRAARAGQGHRRRARHDQARRPGRRRRRSTSSSTARARNQGWARGRAARLRRQRRAASANPPLALDLHYLLTAYGSADFQAEILLGYAMHLLHERPVLDRAAIRKALDPSPLGPSILPPAFQALTAADLADQLEAVTVTPEPMDTEEMSRLWSAMQAHYRPTASYLVSVVLIEARKPARTPLPVLSRGPVDPVTGATAASSSSRACCRRSRRSSASSRPTEQPAARLGETVRLAGHHLDGTAAVARFAHRLLDEPNEVVDRRQRRPDRDRRRAAVGRRRRAGLAGRRLHRRRLARPARRDRRRASRTSPRCCSRRSRSSPPATVTRDATTQRVTVTLDVRPQVRPAQEAQLALGGDTALAEPHPTPTSTLTLRARRRAAGRRSGCG